MLSDHIAQLHKADIYAGETHRFKVISADVVQVTGRHHVHIIRRNGRGWECSCVYYQTTQAVYHCCAHSIALERVFLLDPGSLSGTEEPVGYMMVRDQEV